jgi:Fic family protein
MLDNNWELINGPPAHRIEVLNYANQVNVIEAMLVFILHTDGAEPDGSAPRPVNCEALKELHRTGTLMLLEKPGEYREIHVFIQAADGSVVYNAPPPELLGDLMQDFQQGLFNMWGAADPVFFTAYCLWRLNWIHPFRNGNGRTARAFAYVSLCMKVGFLLPGSPTVIDQILMNKPEYDAALRCADISFASFGLPDLRPMVDLVARLLTVQLSSIVQQADPGQVGT